MCVCVCLCFCMYQCVCCKGLGVQTDFRGLTECWHCHFIQNHHWMHHVAYYQDIIMARWTYWISQHILCFSIHTTCHFVLGQLCFRFPLPLLHLLQTAMQIAGHKVLIQFKLSFRLLSPEVYLLQVMHTVDFANLGKLPCAKTENLSNGGSPLVLSMSKFWCPQQNFAVNIKQIIPHGYQKIIWKIVDAHPFSPVQNLMWTLKLWF